jgi:hypothetical protein
MSRWLATAGRISVFPTPTGGQQSATALFKAIAGTEPTAVDAQSGGDGLPSSSNARGPFADFMLTCTVAPLRIDFTLTSSRPSAFVFGAPFQLIDNPNALLSSFAKLQRGIVEQAQILEVTRVALFLQLTQSVKDVRTANDLIKRVIPANYVLPLTDEQDFILQINSRQNSTSMPSAQLNFVTRWSVEHTKVFMQPMAPDVTIGTITADYFFVHVVCDNNTLPGESILRSDELDRVLSELISGTPSRNVTRLALEEAA